MFEIKRYPGNPILGPRPEIPWNSRESRNPGVVFDGEKFQMIYTAASEPSDGVLRLARAVSVDGFHFTPDDEPCLSPSSNPDDFDHAGCEDARVTPLDGRYLIAYAGRTLNMDDYARGVRRQGPNGNMYPVWTDNFRRVGIAETADFKTFRKLGPITSEHISDANVAFFPEKFGGKYAMLHRPTAFIPWTLPLRYHPGCIWIAFSDRIDHWTSNKREMGWDMVDGVDTMDDYLLLAPRMDWEITKVGASGIPIPTDDGWLMTYHGVDRQSCYYVGLALLDREDPRKVLARTDDPVFSPEGPFEVAPYGLRCVFPCANVVMGDEVFMYYGGGDLYVNLGIFSLKKALEHVKKYPVTEREVRL